MFAHASHHPLAPASSLSWLFLCFAVPLFFLVQKTPLQCTHGDSRLTLLTAQSLLQKGSLNLKPLLREPYTQHALENVWMLVRTPRGTYNFFPPGPSLTALPAVAAATALGMHMNMQEDDRKLQLILAGLSIVLTFWLLFQIARHYVPGDLALFLSLGMVLGTSILSTGGTAFWSHNPVMCAFTWALLLLVREAKTGARIPGWQWMAACFILWSCRPSGLLLSASLMLCGWLTVRGQRYHLLRWGLAGLLGFVIFNLLSLRQFLPDYYALSQRQLNEDFFQTLWWLNLSPSRGFWVYAPFLLAIWPGLLLRPVRRNALFWLGIGTWLMLTLTVARYAEWSGGWSYGPRLLMDALPAMFLALCIVAEHRHAFRLGPATYRFLSLGWLASLLAAIWIHTWQGLYHPAVLDWHGATGLEAGHAGIWSRWEYAQFMATPERNARMQLELETRYQMDALLQYAPAQAPLFTPCDLPLRCGVLRSCDFQLEGHPCACNVEELRHMPQDTLYAPLWAQAVLQGDSSLEIIPYPRPRPVGDLLRTLPPGCTVYLAAQGDVSLNLSATTRDYLRHIGSRAADIRFREAWAAVIQGQTVVAETLNLSQPVVLDWNDFHLRSAAMEIVPRAHILRNGEAADIPGNGIHAVVVAPNGRIRSRNCFNTLIHDGTPPELLKIIRHANTQPSVTTLNVQP